MYYVKFISCSLVLSEGYFGYSCQPWPYIKKTIPSDAIDIGGVDIRVTGYNFGNANSSIQCRFGWNYATVDAELISDNELVCSTPAVTLSGSGFLSTYLLVIVDSQYSYNSVPFSFYGLCPDNQCDQGFCTFGKCVVSVPYMLLSGLGCFNIQLTNFPILISVLLWI